MLADAATVESGKLYVFGGGWDSIFARVFPTRQPVIALAFIFQLDVEEADKPASILIELLDEQDQRIASAEGQGVFEVVLGEKTTFSFPMAMSFAGVVFTKPGEYRFRVWSGEEELTVLPFSVRQAPETLDPAITHDATRQRTVG